MAFEQRLLREFKKSRNSSHIDCIVQIAQTYVEKSYAAIFEMKDTYWEDAVLKLELTFSLQYLDIALNVDFVQTTSFHPSIHPLLMPMRGSAWVYYNTICPLHFVLMRLSREFRISLRFQIHVHLLTIQRPHTDACHGYKCKVRVWIELSWSHKWLSRHE
jgi:hypothetical protein